MTDTRPRIEAICQSGVVCFLPRRRAIHATRSVRALVCLAFVIALLLAPFTLPAAGTGDHTAFLSELHQGPNDPAPPCDDGIVCYPVVVLAEMAAGQPAYSARPIDRPSGPPRVLSRAPGVNLPPPRRLA